MSPEQEQQLFKRFLEQTKLQSAVGKAIDSKIGSYRGKIVAFAAGFLLLLGIGIWKKEWVFTKVAEWMYPPEYIQAKIQNDLRDQLAAKNSEFERKFLDHDRKMTILKRLKDLTPSEKAILEDVDFDDLIGIRKGANELHEVTLREIKELRAENKTLTADIIKLREKNESLKALEGYVQGLRDGRQDTIGSLTKNIRANDPSLLSPDLLVNGIDAKKIEFELSKFVDLTSAARITTLSNNDNINPNKIAAFIAVTETEKHKILPWLRKFQGIEPAFTVSLQYPKGQSNIKSIPVVSYSRRLGRSNTIEVRITQQAAKMLNIPYWKSFQSSGSGIVSLHRVNVTAN